MLQCITSDHKPTLPFGQTIPSVTRTMARISVPRRSLFQASALFRFCVAGLLTALLWAAILWAWQ